MAAVLLVLAFLGWSRGASAQLLASELEMDDVMPYHVIKRDLEFNQYVPAYRLRGEPSCDELRAMWRLSKREARRATSTNQLPRTRPYRYSRLRSFAPHAYGSSRASSFGTMMYNADDRQRHQYRLPQKGSFNKLRAMMGGRRPGAMNDLRDIMVKERPNGLEGTRGQYDNLRGMILKEIQQEEQPVVLSLRPRDSGAGISSRRDPSVPLRPAAQYQGGVFTGSLLAGDPKSDIYKQDWDPLQSSVTYNTRDCLGVQGQDCHSDSECSCDGKFMCSNFRCHVAPQADTDEFGIWYYGAISPELLRRLQRQKPGQD